MDTGGWVELWLSAPRFAPYLAEANADRAAALDYYVWNARVAASFLHDLGHLEVALRNAYDRTLTAGDPPGAPHWVYAPKRHLPVAMKRDSKTGDMYDSNESARKAITKAVKEARKDSKVSTPDPGKVIAEINFGFWRYLTANRLHGLWVRRLSHAFPAGTRQKDVDARVGRLHTLRNRAAHHEPLLRANLPARYRDLLEVAGMLSDPLAAHIDAHSVTLDLIEQRPTG
ncbi:hypothetical protein [Pseudonocardia sp. NPDC049635]|uniref:hypothetical protein n=1 Tax=Pseudonocardia sp. NPDC049635 TaxID=3155506 RepID=UPI0033E10443